MNAPIPQLSKSEPEGIAAALEHYAASAPPPRQGRRFSVRDTAVVLGVACVVAVALDSEGLLAWARRLEVGPVQASFVRAIAPVHAALASVGADLPRRWAADVREELARRTGGEGDPLLAEGWVAVAAPLRGSEPALPLEVPEPVELAPSQPGVAPRVSPESAEPALAGVVPAPEPVELASPQPALPGVAPVASSEPALPEVVPVAPGPEPALPGVGPLAPEAEPSVEVAPAQPEVIAAPGGGVLLLGDSMIAGSLGSTLERTLLKSSGLPVTRAAQLGTGLARPDVYDWMKVVPALLQRDRPRFVVVSLGANDATNLSEGEEQLDYGEARWRQVYAARVEAMMRSLTAAEARVLWLTLPPMRDRRLSARAAYLNSVFAQCARKVKGVEFLEVDVLVGDRQRQFATFVQAPDGKLVRYRLDDGVHLAPAGARAVAVWVRDWVRERTR